MCDTAVMVTAQGVLFAKNSDRDANEAQALSWHPAATHAAGTMLRTTYLEIPQAAHTHAVLVSRPYWMWGAEMGTNEHGVTIGNEAVFTRHAVAAVGLTGMDLLRLGLERAHSAAQAVEVIRTLLAQHGQGGGCGHEDRSFRYHNSYLVADAREAYVLETADRESAVERVTGARSISNGLTVDGFAQAHSDTVKTAVSACRTRRARTQQAAAAATDVLHMMALLRDHGDGAADVPHYNAVRGAMAAPCMHAGGLLAASQTTASWVAWLTPQRARHFATGTAAPCTSIFKPVAVDQPLDLGPWPSDKADPAHVWWRHERLHRAMLRAPAQLLPALRGERDALERQFVDGDVAPAAAWEQAAALEERWWTALSQRPAPADERPWYARRYWATRNQRAGL